MSTRVIIRGAGMRGLPGVNAVANDAASAGYMSDPASLLRIATEDVVDKVVFKDSTLRTVRTIGDGLDPGVFNWEHDGDSTYALHLITGPNTDDDVSLIALGTNAGSGRGLFISHKNTGKAIDITAHGGSAGPFRMTSYAAANLMELTVHAGNLGIRMFAAKGQGFGDGVATDGSTTFTSAAANFTAADVGRVLRQTTGKENDGAPLNTIPAGTTIAAFVDEATVTLSQPANNAGTGIPFLIEGRAVPFNQRFFEAYDEDGNLRYSLNRGTLISREIPGMTSFESDHFQILDTTGAIQTRIDRLGYIKTRKSSIPGPTGMVDGEAALWVDPATGDLKVTSKVGGVQKTGTVAVA